MKEKILEILQAKHELSGGNCGTYIPSVLEILNLEYKDMKNELNSLYLEKKIEIREGAHGQLLFLKVEKNG